MELKRRTLRKRVACTALLIVPYGIETSLIESPVISLSSFNRTLWN